MLCPLSYADVMLDVGFEPTTPGISDQCSTTELIQQSGPDWNRTSDTRIFSPLLYQLSYLGINERAGIRTRDNLIKSQVLYRLSYTPIGLSFCKKNCGGRI